MEVCVHVIKQTGTQYMLTSDLYIKGKLETKRHIADRQQYTVDVDVYICIYMYGQIKHDLPVHRNTPMSPVIIANILNLHSSNLLE